MGRLFVGCFPTYDKQLQLEPDAFNHQSENGGVPDAQTFLVGQPVQAMFVWSNLATADCLYGQPTAINQPQHREPGRQQQGGHVISKETAFESSLIKDIGCWHETKRRRKDGPVRLRPE